MRVLWFTNVLLPDAAKALGLPEAASGGWMYALLKALRKYNSRLEIIVLTTYGKHRRVEIDGVKYITFGNPRKVVFKDAVPDDLEKEIRDIIKDINPDVIHIHGTENYYAQLSPYALCNKPVLVSLQGIINGLHPFYNGGILPSDLKPFYTLHNYLFRDGVFDIKQKWASERSIQEKHSLSNHIHYVGRTKWDKKWLRKYNPNAVYHHLNEIMRPEFYKTRRNIKVCKYSIYCSSAASYPLKGFHWLLRAIAILKKKYSDIQVRVANAKNLLSPPHNITSWFNDRDYASYLRNLIKKLALENNIVCLPALSAIEVADELRRAHIFCLPSLCENSPNSLVEAMLVGTPCVATNVGGISDLLKNNHDGILCLPANHISLSNAILRGFNDDLVNIYSVNAWKKAFKKHNPSIIARSTIELYELISEKREPTNE